MPSYPEVSALNISDPTPLQSLIITVAVETNLESLIDVSELDQESLSHLAYVLSSLCLDMFPTDE